jgi:hypothetical protein
LSKKPVSLEDSPVEPLMVEQQVADAASVHVTAIRKMRKDGEGPPFIVIGKVQIRYAPQAVRDWLKTHQYQSMAAYYAANAERAEQAARQRLAAERVRPMRWKGKRKIAEAAP